MELQSTLERLVKKYNFGKLDEDLLQDAWVCALECQKTYQDVPDDELIKIINKSIQNMFIDKLRKKQLETIIIPEDYEFESNIDMNLYLTELKDSLTEQEQKVLSLLIEGNSPEEISKKLNVTWRYVYMIMNKIKFKIKH